jgi:hypothetical protein
MASSSCRDATCQAEPNNTAMCSRVPTELPRRTSDVAVGGEQFEDVVRRELRAWENLAKQGRVKLQG